MAWYKKSSLPTTDSLTNWQRVHWHAVPVTPWDTPALPNSAVPFPPHQEEYDASQPSTFPTQSFAAGERLGDIGAAPKQKKAFSELEAGEPKLPAQLSELQEKPPQPQPKKHTFTKPQAFLSWEFHALVGGAEQPQELYSENSNEDPLFEALQAVPEVWSPEPLDLEEILGDSPQGSGRGEDVHQKAWEAEAQGLALEERSDFPRGVYVGGRGAAPTSTGFPDSSFPLTLQLRKDAAGALVDNSISGRAGLMRTATSTLASHSGDERGDSRQAAPPGLPPDLAPQVQLSPHLVYRLPILQPGEINASFNAAKAFDLAKPAPLCFPQLWVVRSLLAQAEITPEDAEVLIIQCEPALTRLVYELNLPVDTHGPSRAVERLGRIFIFLDALISAVDVVGAPMNAVTWWPRVAAMIPPKTVYSAKLKAKCQSMLHASMATQLSVALQILKAGVPAGRSRHSETKTTIAVLKT